MKLYAVIAIDVDEKWVKQEPVIDGLDELRGQIEKRLRYANQGSWHRIITGAEFIEWQTEDGELHLIG